MTRPPDITEARMVADAVASLTATDPDTVYRELQEFAPAAVAAAATSLIAAGGGTGGGGGAANPLTVTGLLPLTVDASGRTSVIVDCSFEDDVAERTLQIDNVAVGTPVQIGVGNSTNTATSASNMGNVQLMGSVAGPELVGWTYYGGLQIPANAYLRIEGAMGEVIDWVEEPPGSENYVQGPVPRYYAIAVSSAALPPTYQVVDQAYLDDIIANSYRIETYPHGGDTWDVTADTGSLTIYVTGNPVPTEISYFRQLGDAQITFQPWVEQGVAAVTCPPGKTPVSAGKGSVVEVRAGRDATEVLVTGDLVAA